MRRRTEPLMEGAGGEEEGGKGRTKRKGSEMKEMSIRLYYSTVLIRYLGVSVGVQCCRVL